MFCTQSKYGPKLAAVLLLAAGPQLVFSQNAAASGDSQAASDNSQQTSATKNSKESITLQTAEKIRKAIVTLPQYGVFDSLHFGIQGHTVILKGEASRPTLKSGAERVVKDIEGVENVRNEIDVLPLSPNDDRLRAIVYARIYSSPTLQKYTSNRGPQYLSLTRATMGITQDPPIGWHSIHIIVKNGHVTLTGVVNNQADASIAGMQANTTAGVFSVDNDLMVANEGKEKEKSDSTN